MDRSHFIRLVSAGAVCGAIAPVLTGCASYRYVEAKSEAGTLRVAKSDLGEDNVVLVDHPERTSPIYLRRSSAGEYLALLLECTHKQCRVDPAPNSLNCPCHGSRYDREGRVVQGPAHQDLTSYEVRQEENVIVIQLQ